MSDTPRMFPIMGAPAIPWDVIAPCEKQADINHGQTLKRLAERGGLSPGEAVAVLQSRQWERMPDGAAKCELEAIVKMSAYFPRITELERELAAEKEAREKAEERYASALSDAMQKSNMYNEAEAECAALHERLEDNRTYDLQGNRIDDPTNSILDGIECRNETIRLQDDALEKLRAECAALRKRDDWLIEKMKNISLHIRYYERTHDLKGPTFALCNNSAVLGYGKDSISAIDAARKQEKA